LTAPAEAKEIFPKYDELPTSAIKQLEDKNGDVLLENAEDKGDVPISENGEPDGNSSP